MQITAHADKKTAHGLEPGHSLHAYGPESLYAHGLELSLSLHAYGPESLYAHGPELVLNAHGPDLNALGKRYPLYAYEPGPTVWDDITHLDAHGRESLKTYGSEIHSHADDGKYHRNG